MFKSLSQRSNKADRYPTNVPCRVESDKYEKEKKKRKKGRKEGEYRVQHERYLPKRRKSNPSGF